MTSITLVPSFHYDVAYLKPYLGYLPDCFRILDEALRIMEEDAEYAFLVEQTILLEEYWNRFPEKRELLRKHAQSGRLEVGPGMFVMPDMNLPAAESLYQQAKLGFEWVREHLGVTPRVCWIADCWGHHAQLPQMLSQCGYEMYAFWRCMRRDVLKNDFLWRGLDGTTIRAHWLARGYANLRFPTAAERVNALELTFRDAGVETLTKLLGELREYETANAYLVCNGGDMAFPQASAPQVVRQMGAALRDTTITFGGPSAFLDATRDAALPTLEGEFNSALQGTFTSNIWIKQRTRALVHRLLAIDAAAVLLGREASTREAWRNTLKQEFHDTICGTIGDDAIRDCKAELRMAEVLADSAAATLGEHGKRTTLVNTLQWPRMEIIGHDGGRVRVTVPAFGAADIQHGDVLIPITKPALPAIFENAWYRATIGKDGYVSSLVDLKTNTEVARSHPAPFGSLGLQMDYGDLWLNFEGPLNGGSFASSLTQNAPDPWNRQEGDSIVNRATLSAKIGSVIVAEANSDELVILQFGMLSFWRVAVPFTTHVRFAKHSSRIEYVTKLQPRGMHYRIRVAFPTPFAHGTRRDEIPFGIQQRDAGEHVVQNWTSVSDERAGGIGLAVLNRGIPAANVHDGIAMLTLFRSVAMEYKTESALSFNEGEPITLEYAAMPFAVGRMIDVVRAGHEFNRPLVRCGADAAPSGWGVEGGGGVVLSALRRTAEGVFVRLYEATGNRANATLRLPATVTGYADADGLEARRGDWRPCRGQLPLSLRPLEIKNLILRV